MIGAAGDGADAPTAGVRVKVWDPFVRLGHWALVASTLTAWLTHEGPPALHDRAGYLALGIVVLRVLWGFIGPRTAALKISYAGWRRRLDMRAHGCAAMRPIISATTLWAVG